jgi:hypothetical protein
MLIGISYYFCLKRIIFFGLHTQNILIGFDFKLLAKNTEKKKEKERCFFR